MRTFMSIEKQILANSHGDMTFDAIANLRGSGSCVRR